MAGLVTVPLDKAELKTALRKAFEDASKAVGENPDADSLEILTTQLSNAIDKFVKSGAVVGVVVEVENDPSAGRLIGTQTNAGKVE